VRRVLLVSSVSAVVLAGVIGVAILPPVNGWYARRQSYAMSGLKRTVARFAAAFR